LKTWTVAARGLNELIGRLTAWGVRFGTELRNFHRKMMGYGISRKGSDLTFVTNRVCDEIITVALGYV
jgi:hypothetical protein